MITAAIHERFTGATLNHAWRTTEGAARASVDLGASWLTFESAGEAREMAAVLLAAADAMDALPPAEGGQR